MHIHIVYSYVVTVNEVHYVVVRFSNCDFTITGMVHINFKSPYSNVVVSRISHLPDKGFNRRPTCVVSQFDHGRRVPFKNRITANQDSVIDYICEWPFKVDSCVLMVFCHKLQRLVYLYLVTFPMAIKISTSVSCNINYWWRTFTQSIGNACKDKTT